MITGSRRSSIAFILTIVLLAGTTATWGQPVLPPSSAAPRSVETVVPDVLRFAESSGSAGRFDPEGRWNAADDERPSEPTAARDIVGSDRWLESGPPARTEHVAVFDTKHRRMVVFGGRFNGPHERDDVWVLELDGARGWHRVVPRGTGPRARVGAAAVYDPLRCRMLIIGGADSTGAALNDVWQLALNDRLDWTRLDVEGVPPLPRAHHSATLDPDNDRVIVYGGAPQEFSEPPYGDVWQLSLGPCPAWSEVHPEGPSPIGRAEHSVVYASNLHGLLVFGGTCSECGIFGGQHSDTWFLSTRDRLAWRELAPGPTGTRQCGLRGHVAVYDARSSEMIVFGGGTFGGCFTPQPFCRVYSAGGDTWSEGPDGPDRPRSRIYASAVLDPSGASALLFGGGDGILGSPGTTMADTWALTLGAAKSWSRVAPEASEPWPSRRDGQNLVYDERRDRLLLYDGRDVWTRPRRDGSTWERIAAAGGPAPRLTSVCVYDTRRERLIVNGGYDPETPLHVPRTDTWALSLSGRPVWDRVSTNAPVQEHPCAIYDPGYDRLVQSGIGRPSGQNETWFLSVGDTIGWTLLPSPRSSRRSAGSAVIDSRRNRLLMFGGGVSGPDGWTVSNEVWELPLTASPEWKRLETLPPMGAPPSRAFHGAVYDPGSDRMVVVGGYAPGFLGSGPFDDLWSLDLSSRTWHRIDAGGGPAPKWISPLVTYDSRWRHMVVAEADFSWTLSLESPQRGGDGARRATSNAAATTSLTHGLLGARPNPARGPAAAEISLPDAAPARLELLDLQGRRLWTSSVGALGAGVHRIPIAPGTTLAPGIYLLRLSRGGSRQTIRLVRLR